MGTTIAASATNVRRPVWSLTMNGRDVSRQIAQMVTQVEYTDHTHGQSDELALDVENRDGRWLNAWLPTKGDTIDVLMGYQDTPLLACGQFQIDEIEASAPPDVVRIKAVSAGVIPDLRTTRSAAHDGQTLSEIVAAIAARQQLTVVGDIEPIAIGRVTQHRESDLAFLTRVAHAYGYVFTVRGRQLVFYRVATLQSASAVATVQRSQCLQARFRASVQQTYRACVVTYQDETTRRVITGSATADGVTSGDTLRLCERVESVPQAIARAQAALANANKRQATGGLTISGDTRLVSGMTLAVAGFGAFDGTYLIETSRHRMSRDAGYVTELDLTTASAPGVVQ